MTVHGQVRLSYGDDWCSVEGGGDAVRVTASSFHALQALLTPAAATSQATVRKALHRLGCRIELLVGERMVARVGPGTKGNRLARLLGFGDVQVRPVNLLRVKLGI
ncbi:MAG: hypothetical protein ACYTHJ_03450 [Planctomycetota bacterium]|jgi:hypothetical protein